MSALTVLRLKEYRYREMNDRTQTISLRLIPSGWSGTGPLAQTAFEDVKAIDRVRHPARFLEANLWLASFRTARDSG